MASVIVVGKTKTREFSLADGVTVIGRDTGASIELGDLQVSRRHALLVRAAEGFFVKDLGSRNGVLINQRRVPPRQQAKLRNGDVLSVGRTTLVFKDLVAGEAGASVVGEGEEARTPTLMQVPAPAPPSTEVDEDDLDEDLEVLETPAPAPAPAAPQPQAKPAAARPVAAARPKPRSDAGHVPVPPAKPAARAASGRRGADAIPRALPAGALGGADVLLRALERAEGERRFYRNLVLALVGLVLATFVALLGWALTSGRDGQAPVPVAVHAPAPAAPQAVMTAGDEGALDAAVFARDVHPILSAKCAACHSVVGRGGALVLAQNDDPRTIEANLGAVRRFVRPGRPEESPLLLEPLPAQEGSPGHGGGDVLTMASPEWKTIAAWVAGRPVEGAVAVAPPAPAQAPNSAPEARIHLPEAAARVGQMIPLGAAATDRDGDSISFRWTLRARPAGSAASIEGAAEAQAALTPDRNGTYVIALVAHDGRESGAAEATIVVTAGELVDAPARAPAAATGPAGARAFEALAGRAPTAEEAAALGNLQGEALARALLTSPEPYRAWWAAELEHLGLTGEHQPKGGTWASVPDRLRAGRLSALDALQALLFSQAWTARHAGKEAYVAALLERVLVLTGPDAAAERESAERLHDGHAGSFLGKKAESQADLVRIAGQDARSRRALLARAHRRVVGRDAAAAVLDAALARVQETPADFFPIVVGWACEGR